MALISFESLIENSKNTDAYWIEKAKIDVAVDIYRLMEDKGVIKSELAHRLNVKPPYVTKVLRGESNLTIDSMIKIVHALGGELSIHIGKRKEDSEESNVAFEKAGRANAYPKVAYLFTKSNDITKPIQFNAANDDINSEEINNEAQSIYA